MITSVLRTMERSSMYCLVAGSQTPISDVGILNYSLWEDDGEDDLLKDHTGTDTLKVQPQYNPFAGDIRRA